MDPRLERHERSDMNGDAHDDTVQAVGDAPGESVSIPAVLLPPEYREDGRLRIVASVDRTGILEES